MTARVTKLGTLNCPAGAKSLETSNRLSRVAIVRPGRDENVKNSFLAGSNTPVKNGSTLALRLPSVSAPKGAGFVSIVPPPKPPRPPPGWGGPPNPPPGLPNPPGWGAPPKPPPTGGCWNPPGVGESPPSPPRLGSPKPPP